MSNSTVEVDFYARLNTPAAGWVSIVICSLCFGTNLIPVKKYKMGDGIAFQWLMCSGVLIVGVTIQLIVGTLYRMPTFHPLAMVGGALWATVIIIEAIGLSVGILIWSIGTMILGFATSRFGVFGIPPKVPSNPIMNYIGVVIAVIRGIVLALLVGSLYGNTFLPTMYIQNMVPGASQAGLDYIFAYSVGIWLTSTVIFVVYGLFKRNAPWFPSNKAVLPSLLSGTLGGLAQSSWFISNAALGEPITFPIVATCPALIATLVAVIFFKEVQGKRNFIILGVAICLTITGIILNALSR